MKLSIRYPSLASLPAASASATRSRPQADEWLKTGPQLQMQEQVHTQVQQVWPTVSRPDSQTTARWAGVGAQAARHRSHEAQSNPLSHMECHIDNPIAPPLVRRQRLYGLTA